MNEADLVTPLGAVAEAAGTRKPRKKETKNLKKRGGIWYFDKFVKGKSEFLGRKTPFTLETRDLAVAKAKRDALLKAATGVEIDRVLGRSSKPPAKLSEIFAAYRKAPTVRANEATRERNIADLERLVRVVKGAECNVEALTAEVLTKQLVKDWQAAKLAAAAEACAGDLAALEAGKRAMNSTLTHVQSLFSEEARDDYGTVYLPPNVAEFAKALPVSARRQEEPVQLTDDAVALLFEQVKPIEPEDPAAWVAFQLMTWGGLRNKECLYARASWLNKLDGAPAYRLTMKPAKDFLPKGNSRAVIIPGDIAEAILGKAVALRVVLEVETDEAKDPYLVPAKTASDRHEAIYRRLNTWLKQHGVTGDAGKIAYRLRKYFLKKVQEQQGILLAQAAAGHSSIRTTQDHYVGKPKMTEAIRMGSAV